MTSIELEERGFVPLIPQHQNQESPIVTCDRYGHVIQREASSNIPVDQPAPRRRPQWFIQWLKVSFQPLPSAGLLRF